MLKGPDKTSWKNQTQDTHTDFFLRSFSEGPLVCLFVSEIPKMETLDVCFPNSFTLRYQGDLDGSASSSRTGSTQGVPDLPRSGHSGAWLVTQHQFLGKWCVTSTPCIAVGRLTDSPLVSQPSSRRWGWDSSPCEAVLLVWTQEHTTVITQRPSELKELETCSPTPDPRISVPNVNAFSLTPSLGSDPSQVDGHRVLFDHIYTT